MGANAAVLLQVAGTGLNAYANYQSGKDNEAIQNRNADIARLRAKDAIERGEIEATLTRRSVRQQIGRQRAIFAASGVDITDPDSTAVNVFADTDALNKEDEMVIRANAAREAWGYRIEAEDFTLRGQIARRTGTFAAATSVFNASTRFFENRFGFQGSNKPETLGTLSTPKKRARILGTDVNTGN